ncbi:MAG: hypothetical protein JWR61_3767, partial [Ferruginibacter sp.]|nr:hypothetical protein [Ferruginibacter sp.]
MEAIFLKCRSHLSITIMFSAMEGCLPKATALVYLFIIIT